MDFRQKGGIKNIMFLKYAAAISASITTAGFGIIMSWTSPSLPYLTSQASHFPVSELQGAWIASLSGCGTIIGYLLNPFLVNRMGSKNTLLFLAMPQILSWILIYLGRNWILLCLARIVGGVGYGGGLCSTAVYIGEIGDKKTRGIFLVLIKMSINIGIFITMFFGAFLSYNAMNLALLGIPIIFVVIFSFMPDTNQFNENEEELRENVIHLIKENRDAVLRKNRISFHENKDNFNKENKDNIFKENIINLNENAGEVIKSDTMFVLNENVTNNLKEDSEDLEENIKKDVLIEEKVNLMENRIQQSFDNKSRENIWWKLFSLKNNQMALLIILVASLTDIFSGHMAIVSYTQQIFEYSGASFKAEYAALVLSGLKICASLISTLVVERFGRRILFLSTGILASFAQGLVGLFFFLKIYLRSDVSSITWLPLFGVSMYEVVGSVGLSSLYYVYQGELFSNDVKGPGITCTNIAYEITTFFIKLNFQMVIDAVGIYSVFWGFSVCCLIGSWITYCISPETKGKSREEIQKLLGARD